VSSYAEALDGADIAAATTHAVEPVIRRSWLTPGVHITSVGYYPAGREIDDAPVTEALVCVESRQAVLAPFPAGSNDLLMPIRDGLITAAHVQTGAHHTGPDHPLQVGRRRSTGRGGHSPGRRLRPRAVDRREHHAAMMPLNAQSTGRDIRPYAVEHIRVYADRAPHHEYGLSQRGGLPVPVPVEGPASC
jgi:ornithine cyclodeaminase